MTDKDIRLPVEQERRKNPEDPAPPPEVRPGKAFRPVRRGPFLRLAAFYAVLIGLGALLTYYFPLVREAWVSTPGPTGAGDLANLSTRSAIAVGAGQHEGGRAVSVLLITIGALAISLPVAWVYAFTRRLRYDPSLVHSVIILPMVVSGIVVIVKDSVALAFSLAGIVAVVRFRNTLKDPKDAVYIFLALGIGLAAGVQALDVALVMSLVFNTVVLVLWKYNLGAIYGESARDILAVGNRQLMIARTASQRDAIRWRVSREAKDMQTDGILLVHTHDTEAARQRIELTLSKMADDWRIAENFRRRNGASTFAVMLKLKDKKSDPLTLLAEIDERWSQEVAAAEYLPFRKAAEPNDE